jgi:hypothetical protein
MQLPIISTEQHTVVKKLNRNNVIVDSVAGSGKTTTNLYIAKQYSDRNVLLITYNKKLKFETREKVTNCNINNMEVHSYHSFCVKYYNRKCFTDTIIRNVVSSNTAPLKQFTYDIIVLDELQDMSMLYYELVCKIYNDNDNNNTPKICVLGDVNQCIYEFNGADRRYIQYSDKLLKLNKFKWCKCNLKSSYRVPSAIASFVNNCMVNHDRIISVYESKNPPNYVICNVFDESVNSRPYHALLVNLEKYTPDEIFILAPSLKSSNSAPRKLENLLKQKHDNVPIYVPSSDESKLDEEVIKGKIVFSTFHQAKGMERKLVIVFGFDDSYFKYYKPNYNVNTCPNELYVAVTRAKEKLILIHHYQNNYLQFINIDNLSNYVKIHGKLSKRKQCDRVNNTIEKSVTELTKHLPYYVVDNCIGYLKVNRLRNVSEKIKINNKIKYDDLCEDVSAINGISIASYYELCKKQEMNILNYCLNPPHHVIDENRLHEFHASHLHNLQRIKNNNTEKKYLLYIATIYNSLTSMYLFQSYQIKKFNWISCEQFDECYERLETLNISNKASIEHASIIRDTGNNPELKQYAITGRYDCYDKGNIYEFKCTTELEKEHYLQLAIYMYMHKAQCYNNTVCNGIDNVCVGDVIEYVVDCDIFSGVVKHRFKNKSIRVKCNNGTIHIIEIDNVRHNMSYEKKHKYNLKSNYYLYNILTDELVNIMCSYAKLTNMMIYLIQCKFSNISAISDNDFIKDNLKVFCKYVLE